MKPHSFKATYENVNEAAQDADYFGTDDPKVCHAVIADGPVGRVHCRRAASDPIHVVASKVEDSRQADEFDSRARGCCGAVMIGAILFLVGWMLLFVVARVF
jgi:hypothetical protein